MIIEKQYSRRSIIGYRSPYADPFTYKSILELRDEEVIEILARVESESLSRDFGNQNPLVNFSELVEFAGKAYDPTNWLIAYDESAPVGVVFAQRYWDKMEEGSLFVVGLIPEYRGEGFGQVLHAKGLELLGHAGVRSYVGSTDVQNVPMIRVFEKNGCQHTAVRKIELGKGIV
jgi:ribosomal protein S18 acetylase RimI-like enzyme